MRLTSLIVKVSPSRFIFLYNVALSIPILLASVVIFISFSTIFPLSLLTFNIFTSLFLLRHMRLIKYYDIKKQTSILISHFVRNIFIYYYSIVAFMRK